MRPQLRVFAVLVILLLSTELLTPFAYAQFTRTPVEPTGVKPTAVPEDVFITSAMIEELANQNEVAPATIPVSPTPIPSRPSFSSAGVQPTTAYFGSCRVTSLSTQQSQNFLDN